MFVFYMFSQYPVDENEQFCIKTVIIIIFFYLENKKKFLTLWGDVSHTL